MSPPALVSLKTSPNQEPKPNILFILVDELRWPTVFPIGVNDAGALLQALHAQPLQTHLEERRQVLQLLHRGIRLHALLAAPLLPASTPTRAGSLPPSPPVPTFRSSILLFPLTASSFRQPAITRHTSASGTSPSPTAPATPLRTDSTGTAPPTPPDTTSREPTATSTVQSPVSQRRLHHRPGHRLPAERQAQRCPMVPDRRLRQPARSRVLPRRNRVPHLHQPLRGLQPEQPKRQAQADHRLHHTPPIVNWDTNKLKSPPPFGYPILPPNWQDPNHYAAAGKPTTHTFIQEFPAAVWGGVTR